ncbi:hypothetical protein VB834_15825 [Limnoraphis robusta Tam1]|uniref:hypothetical protein n=1 Tax=Limnoraphis robusta TaxID=1118279 RepID=UPI002B1FBB2B|nr:hypothetical protein [Limnoraphis robusta]MEA5540495.1 hypothetical protein [Limnoraphis robusta Tam1]
MEEKLQANQNEPSQAGENRPFYETASPEERAKAFREWAESHPRNSPSLSMDN